MNTTTARKLLMQERQRLERVRSGVVGELGGVAERVVVAESSGSDEHPADAGSERFEREKDMSIIVNVDVEIHEVDTALNRLADGSYGRCEICHRPIGEPRLRARPAARFCVSDQARVERSVRSA